MIPGLILATGAPDDAPALAALHAQGFDRPWTAAELAATAASPGVATLVAREAARVEGFLMLRVVLDEAEILTLVVDRAARRAGIGAALVEAAAVAARAGGAATLWLEAADDNLAALALYAGVGFAHAGRRRGYYRRERDAVDACVLRRALNTVAV